MWVLSDSKTCSINIFKIYTGKDGDTVSIGLAHKVVYKLMANYKNKDHLIALHKSTVVL